MISFTSNSERPSDSRGEPSQTPKPRRWHTFRRLGWGLLVAVLILGLSEHYIFRNPDVYDLGKAGRGGFIGQWAYLDRAFKMIDPVDIEYAIFGDSQSIDALRPPIMAEELGVPKGRIFNFSVSGGKPTDNLFTYRIYADRMPNLRKVIYVVNEHQLNNADVSADSKFRFHARLTDRWHAMNRDNYGELLTGWVLRSFGMRAEWADLIDRYRMGKWPPEDKAAYPGGIEPLVWSERRMKAETYAVEVADRWFKDWQPDGTYTKALDELFNTLHRRGVELEVIQIPRTDWFEEAVESRYTESRQQYVDRVTQASQAAGAVFRIFTTAQTGLTEDDFRDVNHVNPAGAEKLSRYFAELWKG